MSNDCNENVKAGFAASNGYASRTHLDLFSGIGGFALAAKWNGLETIGFSEIDEYACKILKRHWPSVTNYGDIRNVRGISADIVTGGFPCQPFSVAGEQRGAKDDRHLWPEMLRVITETRPTWVLGENVPGLIGMELDRVLSDLENCGYSVWPVVVPACAVDARHRRDRVWIVANATEGGLRCGNASRTTGQPALGGKTLADSHRNERYRRSGNVQVGRLGRARKTQDDGIQRGAKWRPEPAVGRVAHGIPARSHRLKALGNAIVPQVAANFLHWMLEAEMTWMHNSDYTA